MNWLCKALAALTMLPWGMTMVLSQDKVVPSFLAQEVKFDGSKVKLGGTLLVPKLEAGKSAPGVLLTTPFPVRFEAATHAVDRAMAEYVAASGMVVLSYYNRCAVTSECRAAESFDDYVDDAKGALNFLRGLDQVDPSRIIIIGPDRGGLIAASLASHTEEKLAGVVLMGMPGRTVDKVLREFIQNEMKADRKSDSEIESYLAKYDLVVKGVKAGKSDFSALKLDQKNSADAVLIGLIEQRQELMPLLVNDPLHLVISIKSPILILQAKQAVPGAKDAAYIEDALRRIYHPDATVSLHEKIEHTPDPGMLKVLTQWMEKRLNLLNLTSDK